MSDDIQMLRDLGEVKAELSAVKAELAGLRSVSTMWSFQTCVTTVSACPCSKPALPRLKPPKTAGPGAWPRSWL